MSLVEILEPPWNCFASLSFQFECLFLEVWHVRQDRSLGLFRFYPVEQGSWFPIGLSASMSQHLLPNLASILKNPDPQIMLSVTLGEKMLALVTMLKEKKKERSCFFQWFKSLPHKRPPMSTQVFSVVEWTWGSLVLEEGFVGGGRAVKPDRPQAKSLLCHLSAGSCTCQILGQCLAHRAKCLAHRRCLKNRNGCYILVSFY